MSSLSFETPEDMPRGMKALYEAKMAKERAKQTAAASPEPKPKSKGGKYHAEPCVIGGMRFASKKRLAAGQNFTLWSSAAKSPICGRR